MAIPSPRDLLKLANQINDLLNVHDDMKAALKIINERLDGLDKRMTVLEAEERQVVSEARAAASTAASAAGVAIVGASLNDTITRLTRLENRMDHAGRLSSPPSPRARLPGLDGEGNTP